MRQLLILGFYCEVYRREPLCRIYINDVLVDEFNIPHTTRKKIDVGSFCLSPKHYGVEQFDLESNTPFLKYLEFDHLGDHLYLRIEISNNDNNYTNGFMTQYTRVMLSQCWLAPTKFWKEFEQIKDRWKYSAKNWHKWQNSTNYIAQYFTGHKNCVFNNHIQQIDMYFPDIIQLPLSNEERKPYCSNYQDLPQMWQTFPGRYWTGSSGYFHLTLMKKLGFWRHSTDRRRGWWKISQLHINMIKNLYDKYKQYEDPRSIDT